MNVIAKQVRPKAKAKPRKSKASAPLREVPFKVTNPERIPAQRYYDQEFYDLECKYLWPKVWQMAARLEEIPQVGDWVEYKILDKSVIVIRTKSGVKAFHNACRHRGVEVASGGHGNCATTGFICPFHGWRYDMEGKNTFVFNRQIFSPAQLDQAELNLKPCRLEEWGGCAFINFDDDAAPLLECIKPFADMHDPRKVENLKVEWWLSCDLPTNWKLAMEAFQEGYHVMRTHPQLHAVNIPNKGPHSYNDPLVGKPRTFASGKEFAEAFIANMKVLGEGMGGMIVETDIAVAERIVDKVALSDDMNVAPQEWMLALNDAITKDARARKIDMPDLNEIGPVGPDNYCFPHYFLLPQYGNMSSYRIRPMGPERCLFELYSLRFYPEGTERPIPRAPEPMPPDDPRWPPIPIQDFSNLPKQQLGLHAEGFEYMRLSHAKEGLISNYHRVIDGFLAGVDTETLAKGIQVTCTPLDEAVHDLGF